MGTRLCIVSSAKTRRRLQSDLWIYSYRSGAAFGGDDSCEKSDSLPDWSSGSETSEDKAVRTERGESRGSAIVWMEMHGVYTRFWVKTF